MAEEHAVDELKSHHKLIQRSLDTLIKKSNLYFEAMSIEGDIACLEIYINTREFEKDLESSTLGSLPFCKIIWDTKWMMRSVS